MKRVLMKLTTATMKSEEIWYDRNMYQKYKNIIINENFIIYFMCKDILFKNNKTTKILFHS